MQMTISEALPCHAKSLHLISTQSFSTSWSLETITKSISDSNTQWYILKVDDCIAGFCGLSLSFDYADIMVIAVTKKFRRQGGGDMLIKAAARLAESRGIPKLFIEVRQSNTEAINFYKKHGFCEISKRKGYYQNPDEDAFIFSLDIPVKIKKEDV